ncbi:MAG: hypothetical protein MZW92_36330 [Comamonadaceae bacterium]|nr:hypothetical protein [Comamonadaceae bacterium]
MTLVPVAANELGAKWRLEGETTWRPSGEVVDGLEPGVRNVELLEGLDGCRPVNPVSLVRIVAGATTHVPLAYSGPACASYP